MKYMITFEFQTASGPMTKAFMTNEPTKNVCTNLFAFLTDSFGPFALTDVQICEMVQPPTQEVEPEPAPSPVADGWLH